jgi:serine/threonine-protein kinase
MSTGVKSARAWTEWQGHVVGEKFRLLKYFGGSGRSAVFLTEREQGNPKEAAIKLVPMDDDADGEAQLARWEASAQLSHPHLVRLYETGRVQLGDEEMAYVVMEYGEENLAQVDRPLTEEEAVDMLGCTLEALAYLHGQGLAHSGLKPSNILAVSDRLKVSSDTIRPTGEWSRDLDARQQYDPPEIADEGASAAGDIWSLGITLVEATTSHLPSWETAAAAASLPDGLPGLFRVPVLNCLRRDPRQRWTVADFTTFLQRNIERASAPQQEAPATTGAKRNYLLPAGAVGLALAAAAIVVPRLTNHPAAAPSPAVVQPAVSPREPAPIQPQASDSTPNTAVREPSAKAVVQDILKRVLPDVPAKARNTIRGRVKVNIRVGVDHAGSVVDAKNESPGSSRFFGNLALQAARQWKFASGPSNHSQEWMLHFQFVRDAKHPVSVQAIPVH